MGRRSVAIERRRQIIAATVQCMAAHGVGGTTLERIADAAGMARGHMRHFAGNRDELLTDAAQTFFFGDPGADEQAPGIPPKETPILDPSLSLPEALDYLFGEFAEPTEENPAAFAFIDAGRSIPAIHDIVVRAYLGMHSSMMEILQTAEPDADETHCRVTAYGVLTMAIGNMFITDIDLSQERIQDARTMAEAMLAGLRSQAAA